MTGLEPATSGVTGLRSNQLSYTPIFWERMKSRKQRKNQVKNLSKVNLFQKESQLTMGGFGFSAALNYYENNNFIGAKKETP